MKYSCLYFSLLIFSISLGVNSQNQLFQGTIFFYYSSKVPTNWDDTTVMYCLDSIRLETKTKTLSVLGDYVQNEHFLYVPFDEFGPYQYTMILRSCSRYCDNPLNSYLHEGGDVYQSVLNDSTIYIAFNIKCNAIRVIPEINSRKSDNLRETVKKSKDDFLNHQKMCPCDYTINEKEYIIISEIIKATKLSRKQMLKLSFFIGNDSMFLRYGYW